MHGIGQSGDNNMHGLGLGLGLDQLDSDLDSDFDCLDSDLDLDLDSLDSDLDLDSGVVDSTTTLIIFTNPFQTRSLGLNCVQNISFFARFSSTSSSAVLVKLFWMPVSSDKPFKRQL